MVAERTLVFDFYSLEMAAFGAILGVDRLSLIEVVIDCY